VRGKGELAGKLSATLSDNGVGLNVKYPNPKKVLILQKGGEKQ